MKCVQVYDEPMCCSTGICGPQVDPALPKFASDLEWLKAQGVAVERYNLAQQPSAFVQNTIVRGALETEGQECLPLVLVDGKIMSRGAFPSREILAGWLGAPEATMAAPSSVGGCCGGSSCS